MGCTIVCTQVGHLDELLELEKQCFSVPWTREQFLYCLDQPSIDCFAAVDEGSGAVLGYAILGHVLDEGSLDNIAVSPSRRREGVAAALLGRVLRRAGELSLAFVTLEVRQSNAPAIALYEKFGFVPVGKRKGYYEKPREDAVLMTLFLK